MDLINQPICELEAVCSESEVHSNPVVELGELQLLLVGGGIGDTIL